MTLNEKTDSTDVPVREGDVIDVPYSAAKVVPYGLATLINHLGIGMAAF